MRRALGSLAALAPAVALACPYCARDASPRTWLLVGGLIAAPYLVALGVVKAIRSADRGAER